MQKRRLGKTQLMVTPVGFGGIPIQRLEEKEAVALVREAVERGINFFDSARGYTTSEPLIGKALQGGRRAEVYLASKSMARDAEGFRKEIETTLANMDTDYLDLYQFHNVRNKAIWDKICGPKGALEAAIKAKEQGLIRHIGVSGHSSDVLCEVISAKELETIQVPFNPVESKPAERLFSLAQERDLGIIVMKPLAGGAISPAELSLRWILHHPVSVAIPGMDSISQVAENLAAGDNPQELTSEELEILKGIVAKLGEDFCRRCEYCLPCPEGIDIPMMFIFEGYARRYGMKEWAAERYQAATVKPDACAQCGTCETRCPYDLPIRDKLKGVQELF